MPPGAVPILTLNLQLGAEGDIPDAWHHQMVYGVSPRGVYLCNPVECVPEGVVWTRLVTPSVLLIRSRDIVSRFDPETDMSPLTAVPDIRFHRMNVLGEWFFGTRYQRDIIFFCNLLEKFCPFCNYNIFLTSASSKTIKKMFWKNWEYTYETWYRCLEAHTD